MMTGHHSPRGRVGNIFVAGTPNTRQDKEVTLGELFKSVECSNNGLTFPSRRSPPYRR